VAENSSLLTCVPIGFMKSGLIAKFSARYQPNHEQQSAHNSTTEKAENYIQLINDEKIIRATRDLEGFERIWIIWWFDKNSNWRPLVRPPRGDGQRKGVFSTRAPYRPNPIGITATTLERIEGSKIFVGEIDLIEGTAILDIKPYLPKADAFPDSNIGWLQNIEEEENKPASFSVLQSPKASVQLQWLKENFSIDFLPRALEILSRDPSPHRTRRIVKVDNNRFRMGCGAWRIFFLLENNTVQITQIDKGYPDELLSKEGYQDIPDRDAQLEFSAKFSK
jgi:tRNA-Thr(GGU) m(6)t(6)A37 methyltransferase TsaA